MTGITTAAAIEHEQQRFAHLVLGQPRPKLKTPGRRAKKRAPAPIALSPAIERRVALRERWSHKANGTPETHEHAAIAATREGSLARLARSGAIDAHQLAAAEEIGLAHAAVIADVAARTVNWGPRGGGGRNGAEAITLGQILRERSYTAWRDAAGVHAPMLLAIIIDDLALTSAARRWRLSNRRARTILVDALDRWRRG